MLNHGTGQFENDANSNNNEDLYYIALEGIGPNLYQLLNDHPFPDLRIRKNLLLQTMRGV